CTFGFLRVRCATTSLYRGDNCLDRTITFIGKWLVQEVKFNCFLLPSSCQHEFPPQVSAALSCGEGLLQQGFFKLLRLGKNFPKRKHLECLPGFIEHFQKPVVGDLDACGCPGNHTNAQRHMSNGRGKELFLASKPLQGVHFFRCVEADRHDAIYLSRSTNRTQAERPVSILKLAVAMKTNM